MDHVDTVSGQLRGKPRVDPFVPRSHRVRRQAQAQAPPSRELRFDEPMPLQQIDDVLVTGADLHQPPEQLGDITNGAVRSARAVEVVQ